MLSLLSVTCIKSLGILFQIFWKVSLWLQKFFLYARWTSFMSWKLGTLLRFKVLPLPMKLLALLWLKWNSQTSALLTLNLSDSPFLRYLNTACNHFFFLLRLLVKWKKGKLTLHGKNNKHVISFRVYILKFYHSTFIIKSCLRGKRNQTSKVIFRVCVLKKSNYAHISSFVRTKYVNSYVIWIYFFKVCAACCKSKYVKIIWEI